MPRKIARWTAAAVAAVLAVLAARYVPVPAAIVVTSSALTTVIVRVLLRHWTVLELPRHLQRSRADAGQPSTLTAASPESVTAAPARLALPAPADPVSAQRPRTGTRNAGHGA
jgi:hypothetical protein